MSHKWPLSSLLNAGVKLIDCDHKTPHAVEVGLPYIGIPQLKNGRVVPDGARLISPENFKIWTKKAKPSFNDVILSRRCNPGENAFVPENIEWALGQNLVLLRSDGSKLYPPFLRWICQGQLWKNEVSKYINVGAVFDSLRCRDIPKFEIFLPPFKDQRKISEVLSALDQKIELNQRMNKTLEEMAQAIFKCWFVDFEPTRAKMTSESEQSICTRLKITPEILSLFPDKLVESELCEIPEGWKIDELGSFSQLQNGYAFKSKDWREEGVPVVKIGSVKPSLVDLEQVSFVDEDMASDKSNFRLSVGDILVGLTGYVGETGRIPPTRVLPMLNQRVGRFQPEEGLENFVFSTVRQPKFKAYAESKSHGSAQANVSAQDLLRFPVVAPRNLGGEVFKAFCMFVSPIFKRSLTNSGGNMTLTHLRDTLLPKLLSGELSVENIEGELL